MDSLIESGLRVTKAIGDSELLLGLVREIQDTNKLSIQWDDGNCSISDLRESQEIAIYDLPIVHVGWMCKQCQEFPIKGVRWECTTCAKYSLCSNCYHNNAHSAAHYFKRIVRPISATEESQNHVISAGCTKMRMRHGSDRKAVVGVQPGAFVVPGIDWLQTCDDTLEVKLGKVTDFNSGKSPNDGVRVRWRNFRKEMEYRMGCDGKAELQLAPETAFQSKVHVYWRHLVPLNILASEETLEEVLKAHYNFLCHFRPRATVATPATRRYRTTSRVLPSKSLSSEPVFYNGSRALVGLDLLTMAIDNFRKTFNSDSDEDSESQRSHAEQTSFSLKIDRVKIQLNHRNLAPGFGHPSTFYEGAKVQITSDESCLRSNFLTTGDRDRDEELLAQIPGKFGFVSKFSPVRVVVLVNNSLFSVKPAALILIGSYTMMETDAKVNSATGVRLTQADENGQTRTYQVQEEHEAFAVQSKNGQVGFAVRKANFRFSELPQQSEGDPVDSRYAPIAQQAIGGAQTSNMIENTRREPQIPPRFVRLERRWPPSPRKADSNYHRPSNVDDSVPVNDTDARNGSTRVDNAAVTANLNSADSVECSTMIPIESSTLRHDLVAPQAETNSLVTVQRNTDSSDCPTMLPTDSD